MDSYFDAAVAFVLKQEGGFQNDEGDPGNWTSGKVGLGQMLGTNFGISASQYPNENIPDLTPAAASAIYKRDYWSVIKGDLLGQAGILLLDSAINEGPQTAVKFLQAALDIEQDGSVGPLTVAMLDKADMREVLIGFTRRRIKNYTLLNGWPQFGSGWIERAIEGLVASLNPGA